MIRTIKKSDFNQYSLLRLEGLKDYQKLTDEKLKLSSKQIKKEFDDFFPSNKRVMFVVEEDREIKAFIIGTLIENSYQCITYIDDIFVRENSRKNGFGKRLMNEFEKWSKSKKATRIRLGVRINNKKAIKLYNKIGYQIKHYEMEKKLINRK
jgi:ribosomal protein S18 acetylase RimI-like enzyme